MSRPDYPVSIKGQKEDAWCWKVMTSVLTISQHPLILHQLRKARGGFSRRGNDLLVLMSRGFDIGIDMRHFRLLFR